LAAGRAPGFPCGQCCCLKVNFVLSVLNQARPATYPAGLQVENEMAEITASMVKELRERTDAPMMECKRALTESAGDLNKAEEILRVKLGSKASKAASRITAEGVVAIHRESDDKLGALIESTAKPTSSARTRSF
jgi:hypothetical protein